MHQVALHGCVFVEDGVALRLANLLDHHLLGTLGSDPAEQFRLNDLFALLRLNLARFAIDADGDPFLIAVMPLRRQLQGGLDPLEDHLLGDVLLAVHLVHDPEQVGAIHIQPSAFSYQPVSRSDAAAR